MAHQIRFCLGTSLLGLLLCLSLPAAALTSPDAPEAATGRYALSTATSSKAMVVTANAHASEAARRMLQQGGSAVDAAIAAQAVLGLVEPQSSGFGGGLFLVYFDGRQAMSVDGRETAPARLHRDSFLRAPGEAMAFDDVIQSGMAVGVPGAVAALEASHRRWGRLPWKTLFQPAIALAEAGFPVSPRLHALIQQDRLLARQPDTRSYFFDQDGQPWPVGHLLRNPDYARSLRLLADKGAPAFYRGALALELARRVQARGGVLHARDLKAYRPKVAPAFCQPYRHYRICTAPPPAGGSTVLQALKLIEPLNTEATPPELALHHLMEAERLAFADRQRYSADPAFVPVPLAGLFDPAYLDSRRRLISEKRIASVSAGIPPGLKAPWGTDGQLLERGTTQLSIVDAEGHWLSMTSSIEDAFGSRLLAGGMLLNNQLTDFSFLPEQGGRPLANALAPGKRPRSAMSPTLVFDARGEPLMSLGAPGGSRIIGFVTQALVGSLDLGLSPGDAVQQPHRLSRSGPVEAESDGNDSDLAALRARGHSIVTGDINSGLAIIRREGTQLTGAADPRREGQALAP